MASRVGQRAAASWSDRVTLLRRYGWHLAQCATAAAVAWLLARYALGHRQPFFAPVAAIVSLGLSYQQRLQRVAEVTVGVALGVLVGDLFVEVFGVGAIQVFVVVGLAMTLALLLDAGPLLVTQAGVQSAIVATLAPGPVAGLGRWLDAVCGGIVALVAAAVVPGSPLRRPRQEAASVLRELAAWCHDTVRAVREQDEELAYATLARARNSEGQLADVQAAAYDGLSIARSSPWRRGHRSDLLAMSALSVMLDRAVRNGRVLLRRVTVVVRRHEQLDPRILTLLGRLADVIEAIAADLEDRRDPDDSRELLQQVARESAAVPVGTSLSDDVVLAQVRSMVVDLLELTGLDADAARAAIPTSAGETPPDRVDQ
ncbi:FUSC family protein [Angustibacter luteus]|uniref:Aromatic acid exporter family protein n=1 Tax=Angustibacter luteus TaxID=658456 RepID=A0ABW1J9T2_9ACTN